MSNSVWAAVEKEKGEQGGIQCTVPCRSGGSSASPPSLAPPHTSAPGQTAALSDNRDREFSVRWEERSDPSDEEATSSESEECSGARVHGWVFGNFRLVGRWNSLRWPFWLWEYKQDPCCLMFIWNFCEFKIVVPYLFSLNKKKNEMLLSINLTASELDSVWEFFPWFCWTSVFSYAPFDPKVCKSCTLLINKKKRKKDSCKLLLRSLYCSALFFP